MIDHSDTRWWKTLEGRSAYFALHPIQGAIILALPINAALFLTFLIAYPDELYLLLALAIPAFLVLQSCGGGGLGIRG